MKGIGEFLERFKNFVPPNRALVKVVREALFEVLRLMVSEKDIRVVKGVANIQAPGAVKSEIRLHRKEITAAVQAKTGTILRDIQ